MPEVKFRAFLETEGRPDRTGNADVRLMTVRLDRCLRKDLERSPGYQHGHECQPDFPPLYAMPGSSIAFAFPKSL